jgi:hypothetical protein
VPDYPLTVAGTEKELTWFAFRDKKSGLDVVALWDGTEIPSNSSDLEQETHSLFVVRTSRNSSHNLPRCCRTSSVVNYDAVAR